MAVCDYMTLEKDQTTYFSFEGTGIAFVESIVDAEGDLDLQKGIDHVEGMSSDMDTQKVADSK